MTKLTHGAPAHFDISGEDSEILGSFYSALFDWHIDPKGPGYSLIETPGGTPNGAIVEMETASITLGIAVKDLSKTLTSAETSGGKVVMPVTDNGWVKKAQISDPSGNLLTLIEL